MVNSIQFLVVLEVAAKLSGKKRGTWAGLFSERRTLFV